VGIGLAFLIEFHTLSLFSGSKARYTDDMQFERPESSLSRWSTPGYRPHHMGPLWVLWKVGLTPTKRQADFILLFVIVASSAWSYLIIFHYTSIHEDAFSGRILTEEVFTDY
jgi:hypothetical protein